MNTRNNSEEDSLVEAKENELYNKMLSLEYAREYEISKMVEYIRLNNQELFEKNEKPILLIQKDKNLVKEKNLTNTTEVSEKAILFPKTEIGDKSYFDSLNPIENGCVDKKLVNTVEDVEEKKEFLRPFYFYKYPGVLHVSFGALSGYISNSLSIGSFLSLKVEYVNCFINKKETKIVESKLNEDVNDSNMSFYLKFPVEFSKGYLTAKVMLQRHQHKKTTLLGLGFLKITADDFNQFHNNLVLIELKLYDKQATLWNKILCGPTTLGNHLCLHVSYISNDEIPTINTEKPYSLFTLCKWLVIRKYAIYKLFSGYVNIKGNMSDPSGYLWKRRYIRIFGYTIFVFEDRNNSPISTVNITDAIPHINSLNYNIIGFSLLKTGRFEIHCDHTDTLNNIKSVLSTLFPQFIEMQQ